VSLSPAALPPTPSQALRSDGRREPIVPLDVHGRFIRARRVVFTALIALYACIPLVVVGGHPAIHLDIRHRQFFLLGAAFNAQDVWMAALLALSVLFGLLLVTAWRGRLWCGWACPQTVFLEGIYRPLERLFEGPRSRRLRLAGQPLTAGRFARTAGKQASFVLVSLLLGHAALIPFVPLGTMPAMFRDGPGAHPLAFAWAMALSALVYLDFAWFREQLCVVLCPYGRLQSVLHDRDSIVIAYDAARGEPRAPLRRRALPVVPSGDCVDCKKCVWACPTGIDIRNGFQMDCIACAQCIDVCDEVMDKVGRPRGLIRYAPLAAPAAQRPQLLRPRLMVYAALAAVAALAFTIALVGRTPFEANVIRLGGVPWVVDGDTIRNQVEIHLINKRQQPRRFRIQVLGPVAIRALVVQPELELAPMAQARIPTMLVARRKDLRPGERLTVVVEDRESGDARRTPLSFLAPPGIAGGPAPLTSPVP
jgi:cytochrome c oxidase accessory protein FixG